MIKYCKCGHRIISTEPVVISCPICKNTVNVGFGLGDWIEQKLGLFGLWYKHTYKRITGRQCHCEQRKAWLNRFGSDLRQRFLRRTPRP